MDIESLIASVNRAQQAEDAGLGNCSRTWHVGFFFDGIHRNIERDAAEHRLSNVARLFRAFPDEVNDNAASSYSKFYISGLGTPFNEELAAKLHAVMDGAQSSVLDDLKDQPSEIAKEAGVELLKGGNWYEVFKQEGKKLINPLEWKKLLGDSAKKAALRVGIEATPWLRDNAASAELLVAGVDTRIASTKLRFERFFERVKSSNQVPIKLISISLFGFDLGATLARKFIDTLLEDICQKQDDKYTYQGIQVDIIFTGLFDCSRYTPASSKNGLGKAIGTIPNPGTEVIGALLGVKSIDHDSALPGMVKNALHLVAAHETRVWRCIYRLGSQQQNHQEELLPGCSEDIGGGLKPNEQKPSAELCRVALHRMYRAGMMAGVPFPDFQTLQAYSATVASYFVMQDNVNNKSVAQWAKLYQQAVPQKILSIAAQNAHLDSYIDWLGQQHYQYRTQRIKYVEQRGDILASAGASAGLIGISHQAYETVGTLQEAQDILDKNWGWLQDVHDAASKLVRDTVGSGPEAQGKHPYDTRMKLAPGVYGLAVLRAKKFHEYGVTAYMGLPAPLPYDSAPPEIYAWFVHHLLTVERGGRITDDFFMVRTLEMPSD